MSKACKELTVLPVGKGLFLEFCARLKDVTKERLALERSALAAGGLFKN